VGRSTHCDENYFRLTDALSGRGQAAGALLYSDMPTLAWFRSVVGKSVHFCDPMQLSSICRKSQTGARKKSSRKKKGQSGKGKVSI